MSQDKRRPGLENYLGIFMVLLTHVNKITITPVCLTDLAFRARLNCTGLRWQRCWCKVEREGRRDCCHPCPAAANREETFGTIDFSTGEA